MTYAHTQVRLPAASDCLIWSNEMLIEVEMPALYAPTSSTYSSITMILIGQYDSPFVRRVGIALTIYEIPFDHRPWSTFGDVEKIRPYNPLTRVPTLVLDNGDVLIESQSIIDYLDSLVGPDRAMFPISEPTRHRALKIASLAIGLGDKAASLYYSSRGFGCLG
jgi:hypothetical protein